MAVGAQPCGLFPAINRVSCRARCTETELKLNLVPNVSIVVYLRLLLRYSDEDEEQISCVLKLMRVETITDSVKV